MEPNQTTPPVLETKPNHKILLVSILTFIFVILFSFTFFWFFPLQALSFFGVEVKPLCIPDCGAKVTPVYDTSAWKTYRNEEYGFEMKIPEDWISNSVGYKDGDLDFSTSTPMGRFSIMRIGTTTKEGWNEYKNCNCPRPSYISEKNGVIFVNWVAQDLPNELTRLYDEISPILSTFKFINKPLSIADYQKPFQKGELDYYGTVTLTGYLVTEEEQFMDSEILNYANFYFTKTDNDSLVEYLRGSRVNSDIENYNYIGLGCYDKSKASIDSINSGDFDLVNNKIVGEDLEQLLLSSKTNQIKIQVSKTYVSSGRGAPACYSQFRNFKMAK